MYIVKTVFTRNCEKEMKDGRTFYHCGSLLTENRAGRKTEILCLIWIMLHGSLDQQKFSVTSWG